MMRPLTTERLILRNWTEADRPLFRRINADEQVMAFFPFRRSAAEADALMDRLRRGIDARGYGLAAAVTRLGGEVVGFVGIQEANLEPAIPDGSVEIGWRLAPEYWGRGYVTEAARAWLAFGFETLGLAEIVSFAVRDNHRSTAVMQRLGMRADPSGDFDMPNIPEAYAALRPHVLYRLDRHSSESRQDPAAAASVGGPINPS